MIDPPITTDYQDMKMKMKFTNAITDLTDFHTRAERVYYQLRGIRDGLLAELTDASEATRTALEDMVFRTMRVALEAEYEDRSARNGVVSGETMPITLDAPTDCGREGCAGN